ncbi:MAG: alpha/beta hydrolase [Chloroflexaceae bacterium]|nr:alpha/beta hydrolase [Chloroflexaceae bacterium]
MSSVPKFFLTLGGLAATIYLGICLYLYFWQQRLIFLPSNRWEVTPTILGVAYEEVWLPVPGQTRATIHGWCLPKGPESDVILYLHGNGSNVGGNLNQAQQFRSLGFSVLLIDYRGYGHSKGNFPTEKQVYEDARLAWNYLLRERQIGPDHILSTAIPWGGAIAIELALRYPEVAGLILEGTFTSIQDLGQIRPAYRLFPISWLLTQRFDSLGKIRAVRSPLLFIHGTADDVVPAQMSEILYEAARSPKRLLLIPQAGHNNVSALGAERYSQAILEFQRWVKAEQLAYQSLQRTENKAIAIKVSTEAKIRA